MASIFPPSKSSALIVENFNTTVLVHPIYRHYLKIISISLFVFCLSIFHRPFPSLPLCQKALQSLTPTTQGVAGRSAGDGYQLLVAVVGSVTVTCVTILLALLALFFIRKTLLNRRRTFTYQSGSVRTHRDLFIWFFHQSFGKLKSPGWHHSRSDKAQMSFEKIVL